MSQLSPKLAKDRLGPKNPLPEGELSGRAVRDSLEEANALLTASALLVAISQSSPSPPLRSGARAGRDR
jgi:hypothetical protein